ncbi:MAG: hypothetical protein P0Y48_12340 [Candidatus Microbacterium phytovorans]|uniref:Uncharacterized protein n=1 Tax=Candidatus Microbacterium phytovorans TaxID=3121374 RepID=A0AAJ6B2I4_9MICO|nr:hypothetical protein [Microbacterium sp.]WEK13233.1 MAG: hypothetical protein P0Y48_12340 [Microbacterium sp.]
MRHATNAFVLNTVALALVVSLLVAAVVALARWDPTRFMRQLTTVTGMAAPWVVPVYITALVAALAVLTLPDWQGRANDDVEAVKERATVRRAIGSAAYFVGPAYAVWVLLAVVAALWPRVPVGDNGGVALAWPIVLMLTVLVSRAAVGTLEQRHEDAAQLVDTLTIWRRRVNVRAYPKTSLGRSLTLVALIVVAPLTGVGVALLAAYGWRVGMASVILLLLVHTVAVSMWAARYQVASRPTRRFLATGSSLFLAAPTAAIVSSGGLPYAPVFAVGVALPAAAYLVPWGGRQLLAATALQPLDRRLRNATEYRNRCAEQLERLHARPHRWWQRNARPT